MSEFQKGLNKSLELEKSLKSPSEIKSASREGSFQITKEITLGNKADSSASGRIEVKPSPSAIKRTLALINNLSKITLKFIKDSYRVEWGAGLVSFVSALPTNLLTCIVAIQGASLFLTLNPEATDAERSAFLSFITVTVGYLTYQIGYWIGLLYKERRELFDESGNFIPKALKLKLRAMLVDFIAHIPTDLVIMPAIGLIQFSLHFGGVLNDFWSIFWAQAVSDLIYSFVEPTHWYAAKRYVAWEQASGKTAFSLAVNWVRKHSSDRRVLVKGVKTDLELGLTPTNRN